MNTFSKKFIFIILFIIYFINSLESIPIWENNNKTSNPYEFINNKIDSYAFDDETGSEIYLEDKTIIYNSNKIPIGRYENLKDLGNQIIELNSYIYFCSSAGILLRMKDGTIEPINNPEEIKEQNYSIKCLRGYNSIIVVFLNTEYFCVFYPEKDETHYFRIFNIKYGKILAFNNYADTNDDNPNEYSFTSLSIDDKHYYFRALKIHNINQEFIFIGGRENNIPIDNLILYKENIEIVTLKDNNEGTQAYLFSYNHSENFSFYIIDLETKRNFIDGRYYFRSFNDFEIKFAKFVGKTTFLYYSIESLKNDHKKYIGLADLKYYLLLYNIEASTDKLYFNYGNYFKNKAELFYFSETKKISFCPFIKGEDSCSYDYSHFDISKYGSFYKNEKTDNCLSKKTLGIYCITNCTIGYYEENNNNICQFCNFFKNDRFFFYKEKKCLSYDNCLNHYTNISGTCYDCGDIKYYNEGYNVLCTENCNDINTIDLGNNSCKSCKTTNNTLFSLSNKTCKKIEECINGEKDLYSYTCEECEFFGKLYFDEEKTCVEKCPFLFVNKSNECKLCDENNNEIYEEGKCNNTCSNDRGYGKITQIFNGKNVTYCMKCIENEDFSFLDGDHCISSCGPKPFEMNPGIYKKCNDCGKKLYVEKAETCEEECPEGWVKKDNTCNLCDDNYDHGNCLSKCNVSSYSVDKYYINENNNISILYHECAYCEPKRKIVNNKCSDCDGNFYNLDGYCYTCFCGGNFNCTNLTTTSYCNCSDPHYYGENCEFLSENDITDKKMKIVSLNNKLIKTNKNYFTYEFNDNIILFPGYSFEWKVLLNGKKITQDKKYIKYFVTSTNEAIFGINKELFEKPYNKTIELSLDIIYNSKIEFSDKITLLLIDSFEYDNRCNRGYSGNLGLFEMKSNFVLEDIKSNNNYNGRYLSQYRLLDYDNEKMPITNYSDSDSININLICSNGYDISTLNDLEEKQESTLIETKSCSHSNLNFDEILKGNFSKTEKMFLLISYLRKIQALDDIKLQNIIDFINEAIPLLINEQGYYIEKNCKKEKQIIYSEPKLIFSLINNLAYKIKGLLTEKNLSLFFNFTREVFENNNLTSKSLSESDIKSLFRTIDNLYDISIEKDLKSEFNNFIVLFDNITKYLSIKTYPSEAIRLIGKRISILNYHFGTHQKYISFPYIDKMEERKIKDFLTYSYDNYFLNEDICSLKNSSLFCLTYEKFEDLTKKLFEKNYNLDNIFLNIYLLQEINNKSIQIIDENDNFYSLNEIIEKININKNYSIIYKLFIKENDRISLIQDNDIELNLDIEFPFALNNTENLEKKEKNKNNYFSDEKYFDEKGWNITTSINNSEYTCVPKSFYENNKKDKNIDINKIKNYCFTHFDYYNHKIRCSCKTKLNDEIIVIKDLELSNTFKHMQFEKQEFNMLNKYTLFIIYFLLFLLLIPIIFFLIIDILKESKIINEKPDLKEIEEENNNLKNKYKEIKKYNNTGIFSFSICISLTNFPLFYEFNKYKNNFPIFIKHLIICIGFFIGIIVPLIPFCFLPFSEKQTFIDQRNIDYDDNMHKSIKPLKYFIISITFSIIGIIFGNTFIYIFLRLLKFEKEELDMWRKIKILCQDYVYEIKSDVLLGAIWKKIKLRIHAYYYICGNFILNKKKKNKFSQYLNHILRNDDFKMSDIKNIENINRILPSSKNRNEEIKEPLIINDDEEAILNNKNLVNDDNNKYEDIISTRKRNKNSLYSNSSQTNKKYDFSNVKIIKLDNFMLDNKKYNKSKRQIERYEKIRNKYIYVSKKNINENDDENEDKNIYFISSQINYSCISIDSFHLLFNDNNKETKSYKIVFNFIIISSILFIAFIILLIFMIILLHKVLQIFGIFILYVWIIPAILIITIGNFIIYFLKILIGSILLFHYYHLKNEIWAVNCFFWIFVDKTMINIFKVRNLITKYKKEFDYLLN